MRDRRSGRRRVGTGTRLAAATRLRASRRHAAPADQRAKAQADAAADGDPAADSAFTAAIVGLLQRSTPYHLAHGLLDYAEHLRRTGDEAAAVANIDEARGIAGRLRCQQLLDRVESMASTERRILA